MVKKVIFGLLSLVAALILAVALVIGISIAIIYPTLPDVSELTDYRPKLPLRIYAENNTLIGEFGEERRKFVPINEIPVVMKQAILSIEDSNFYSHSGIDPKGILRASLSNLSSSSRQGASTISMQVARNVYLSNEQTYTRKIYEMMLTFKLEKTLTKDQILEVYMNQIYLGEKAYGFAAASETYFGKPLSQVSIAEAAMLAGLPKAPSKYNPIVNLERATVRQQYIIERMLELGYITPAQAEEAKTEVLEIKKKNQFLNVHADYVAEMARQLIFAQYGELTYTRGINVYTTLNDVLQNTAYQSLRQGIMDYERRQIYRGPEKFFELGNTQKEIEDSLDEIFNEFSNNDDILPAVVLTASPQKIEAVIHTGEHIEIITDGLKPVQSGLSNSAPAKLKIKRGAVIRVYKNAKGNWQATQLPEVEGAFVATDPKTGGIKALVGGFDFNKNKFNHVTQAWRQPGSSFKPFIYSASLEKGLSPATVIDDSPLFFTAAQTGGQAWEPKNYDATFDGPMSMRTALAKSKNMVSIRILQEIEPQFAQDWITRFGFDASRHPAYLTMALGAGSVTPLQMASAYSVFANGGHFLKPYLITKITDQKGNVLVETAKQTPNESNLVIEPRNAYVTTSLLQEVTVRGTAAKAAAQLKRTDIYGKTGTTNDAIDAWFAGYHPSLVAVVWMGYDTPRNLGSRETGGGLSLPIWIRFMDVALKNTPIEEPLPPTGLIQVGNEWYYQEFGPGNGVASLKNHDQVDPETVGDVGTGNTTPSGPMTEEKKSILDLFLN